MVEESEDITMEESGEFLDMPEREVNLEELGLTKTLTAEEETTEHRTDLQAITRALQPRYQTKRLNDLLQPVMVSRIFPDNYLDLNYLLVMSLVEEEEEKNDIDFVGIVSPVQAATSIGYEGRFRVELIEVAGVAHEEEMEKLSKELGLGA